MAPTSRTPLKVEPESSAVRVALWRARGNGREAGEMPQGFARKSGSFWPQFL